eukprot:886999-Prorocentrum_lima.AAC.1
MRAVGFRPTTDWRSCFVHPDLKLFLVVYVDDLKMAGPKGNLAKVWKLIRTPKGGSPGLALDDPTGPDRYVG